ncbi:hypothetical protein F443_17832 [Phytophthora nicotianae P1569]|uniref:Uncharacterized protein n=1 Tax=Phytophthora nicotianae P1569 TaxID=1317065 RepID=V9EAD8_PHYNI|nr:hypothetical protein F443_17832 [Phytophthora nicotianae P1569]
MESQDQRPPEQAVESSPDHSRPLRTRSHPRFSPYSSTTRPLWRATRSLDAAHFPRRPKKVNPLRKKTKSNVLRDTVKSGNALEEIHQHLWNEFTPRAKGRAVNTDDISSFTVCPRILTSHRWLVKMRGQTVKLLIYEYGADIARAQDLEDFKAAHVVPDTDRAGAPSEGSLGDVAQSLKEAWSTTFQAEDVVWRLWGNHVTTNLDRSTWDAMIQQPPPQQLVHLFRRTLHSVHRYRVVERVDVHVKVGELD